MDTAFHTLQEFMAHSESVSYILIVVSLFALLFFWKFLTGRDDQ